CELRTRPRLVLDVVDQHRELGALVAPADVLGGVEERLERRAYRGRVPAADRLEVARRLRTAEAKATREGRQLCGVARHDVGLSLVDDLDLVLDVPEEPVRGGETIGEIARDVAGVRERGERGERRARSESLVLAAVDELLRLHEELDLADTAPAELHVGARGVGAAERRIDLPLHRLQVLDRPEVEVAPVDERHELPEQRLAERAVAADGPRLQPRRALPRLSPRLVVRERGRQRDRHRPLRAPGTQAKIDAKDEAVLGELAQRARHLLRKTREELRERPAR